MIESPWRNLSPAANGAATKRLIYDNWGKAEWKGYMIAYGTES